MEEEDSAPECSLGTDGNRSRPPTCPSNAGPLKRSVRRPLAAEHHIDTEEDQLKLCS